MKHSDNGYEVESTPRSAGRSEKSVAHGFVVIMPVIVTALAAAVLCYLCYGDPGGEHFFLLSEVFIVAGCFFVYVSSLAVGFVLAIVSQVLRRRCGQ